MSCLHLQHAFWLVAACLLLAMHLPAAEGRINRATIACSMYVSPCHCGLCPRVVDCSKQPTAECFCGTASPGIYPHPSDPSKFWMCSFDTQSHIPYGVEVPCPARLVFDPVVKVCTVPAAVSPSPSQPSTTATKPPGPTKGGNTPSTSTTSSTTSNITKGDNSQSSHQASSQAPKGQQPVAVSEDRAAAFRTPTALAGGSWKAHSAHKP